jgi:hypothetical protein
LEVLLSRGGRKLNSRSIPMVLEPLRGKGHPWICRCARASERIVDWARPHGNRRARVFHRASVAAAERVVMSAGNGTEEQQGGGGAPHGRPPFWASPATASGNSSFIAALESMTSS